MNFQFDANNVIVTNYSTEIDSKPQNVVKNLKVVQTKKVKEKYSCTVIKNKDRKRQYALRYYLVNQDNKILNLSLPCLTTTEAMKTMKSLINADNTSIYILPMKIVTKGGRFIAKGTIKNPPAENTYVLVAEL